MKIVSIVGARPRFIKYAPLSCELRTDHHEVLVHTGQHYDPEMSRSSSKSYTTPRPDYHLWVSSGPHGKQTGEILAKVEEVPLKEKPDLVLEYGDRRDADRTGEALFDDPSRRDEDSYRGHETPVGDPGCSWALCLKDGKSGYFL